MVRASVRLVVRLVRFVRIEGIRFCFSYGTAIASSIFTRHSRHQKALKRKKWSQTYIAGAVDCSRQTIWSLLQGNPTDCDVFMEVCTQLGLNWEEIAEPESPEPEQNDSQDIDALVREVRSHCCEAILDSYSKIRLLDDTRIDVDLLYVDVYVLEKLSSKRYASISGLLEGVEQREDYERLALGQHRSDYLDRKSSDNFPIDGAGQTRVRKNHFLTTSRR
jgi:transcriptional regulator with XRE-family HTH domain